MEENQVYRASVAAIIVNNKNEFLLTQSIYALPNKLDFVKGGMKANEEQLDTLNREIQEELGKLVEFRVLKRSNVFLINDWTKEMQESRGLRGQARVSYWVLYEGGEIAIDPQELKAYKWLPCDQVSEVLEANRFPKIIAQSLMEEWEEIRQLVSLTY